MERNPSSSSRLDTGIIIALLVALIARPVAHTLCAPRFFHGLADASAGRGRWWLFYAWILFWEWLSFCVIWLELWRSSRKWLDIGVDWRFFARHRTIFLCAAIAFMVMAIMAPRFLYYGVVPRVSQTSSILPVTGLERLIFLVAAASGGICEEVCYRGLPLRMFAGSAIQAWLVLPAVMLAFVFIHGWPSASQFVFFSICGLLYGGVFILLGRRRLEWLITAHVLYDSLFILMP